MCAAVCAKFAANIRRRRERKGWTQKEAAGAAGMTQQQYQRLEGGVGDVGLLSVIRVASAFACDFRKLLK